MHFGVVATIIGPCPAEHFQVMAATLFGMIDRLAERERIEVTGSTCERPFVSLK
jgi:hypothetical protein